MKKAGFLIAFLLLGVIFFPNVVGSAGSNLQEPMIDRRSCLAKTLTSVRFWAFTSFGSLALTLSLTIYFFANGDTSIGTIMALISLLIMALVGAAYRHKAIYS